MLSLQDNIYWIWTSRLPKIGTKTLQKLLKKYDTLENIYKLTQKELMSDKIIGENLIETILNEEYRKNLDKYIEYMEREKINIITVADKEYPEKLKQINDCPMYLYVKGNLDLLNKKSIAMVGSRKCTSYGKIVAKNISNKLAKNNFVVVSGLAKGIDTFSHIGALENEKSTIAVLGSSIDNIYPNENINLAKKIIEKNGLIMSEYVIGSKPERLNFPARNRIISGISDGVLVIEAREKSGALITVDFALEQGKEIFAVPGNINNIYSKGSNQIIKEGAKLVNCVEDILEEI